MVVTTSTKLSSKFFGNRAFNSASSLLYRNSEKLLPLSKLSHVDYEVNKFGTQTAAGIVPQTNKTFYQVG